MRDTRASGRGIVWVFALSLLASAPAAANSHVFRGRSGPAMAWSAADLDGDRMLDLARPGEYRADGAGFVQQLNFRFGSSERATITVRLSAIAHRVSARDLDGDSDRDLVLEGLDRRPIAVLLNDGSGHFHQGNLADYRAQLPNPERRSFDSGGRENFKEEGCAPAGAAAIFSLMVPVDEAHAFRNAPQRPSAALNRAATHTTRGPPHS